MTHLVDPAEIERLVGARRDPTTHLGRAVSEDENFYILHSQECLDSGIDLRDCMFSVALDSGIDSGRWKLWQDRPVGLLVTNPVGLLPFTFGLTLVPVAAPGDVGSVTDGYSEWQRCGTECTLEVVRIGKVQCVDLATAINDPSWVPLCERSEEPT